MSYPGYDEIFTGAADPFVSTNKKKRNKHITLLEYLNHISPYKDKVAAYTSWDVFPYILNEERSKIYVNSGYQANNGKKLSHKQVYLNKINNKAENADEPERYDMLTFLMAKEFILKNQPKIFYLALGGKTVMVIRKIMMGTWSRRNLQTGSFPICGTLFNLCLLIETISHL